MSLDQLAPALVAFQGELQEIIKGHTAEIPTKTGGKYKYTYADLKDVLAYVRPLLKDHGLAVVQRAFSDDKGTCVSTVLVHTSGQSIESGPLRLPAGADAQSHGSAITFARRYSLMAALGLATEDDDGAAASKPAQRPPARKVDGKPGMVTNEQMNKMLALFNEGGISQRQQRLDYVAAIVNRTVGSSKELTKSEASLVIDALILLTGPQ